MKNFWIICSILLAVSFGAVYAAQNDDSDSNEFGISSEDNVEEKAAQDYPEDDRFDSFYDYVVDDISDMKDIAEPNDNDEEGAKKYEEDSSDNVSKNEDNDLNSMDEKVEEEIKSFLGDSNLDADNKDDDTSKYQIEDNRSVVDYDEQESQDELTDIDGIKIDPLQIPLNLDETNNDDDDASPLDKFYDELSKESNDDVFDDSEKNMDKIEREDSNEAGDIDDNIFEDKNEDRVDSGSKISQEDNFIEENFESQQSVENIANKNDDSNENNLGHSNEVEENQEWEDLIQSVEDENNFDDDMKEAIIDNNNFVEDDQNLLNNDDDLSDQDTLNQVYSDLKDDLESLFDTLDKLANSSESNEDGDEQEEQIESKADGNDSGFKEETVEVNESDDKKESLEDENLNVSEYEEKYGRPYREDYILNLRDSLVNDYDALNEQNDDEYVDDIDFSREENGDDTKDSNPESNDEDSDTQENDNIFDDDNANLDDNNESFEDDLKDFAIPKPIMYQNDGIAKLNEVEENPVDIQSDVESVEKVEHDLESSKSSETSGEKEQLLKPVDEELTSAEVNELMTKFALEHVDELDVNSKNFNRDTAPIHIELFVDKVEVVTSPNYPNPYTTNNVVDWIFEGDGRGIELNITDFAVNGFVGDYLLVKPGGVDESGNDGLVFSYQLNSERRYRFLDVNKMFVRFVANPGMMFYRGFNFTVRLVSPPITRQEQLPEPEAVIEEPTETLLVYLGGVNPSEFQNVSEDFRLIVADMATLFINNNAMELGDKTTAEVTQITQNSTCNLNWPGFEQCTGVRFGVPLQHEDLDLGLNNSHLNEMWRSYVNVDPFASRLRALGISEFVVPDTASALVVWLVIGFGVALSAAMLALALWRWSCFEDYTRMSPYSDTESVLSSHKKDLDLYPTPHQTLPPLYDDDFIKYEDTARVDMGGYSNKSFTREGGLFDLESDDEISSLPSTKRQGFTTDV